MQLKTLCLSMDHMVAGVHGCCKNKNFYFPNEVEYKPPPARCELGNLKEKNLVQWDAKGYEFWTLFQHDEVASTS